LQLVLQIIGKSETGKLIVDKYIKKFSYLKGDFSPEFPIIYFCDKFDGTAGCGYNCPGVWLTRRFRENVFSKESVCIEAALSFRLS
jgi:hypothetical protein